MIRIPGSYNSKCVARNNNIVNSSTEVRIIQRWDGVRPKFNALLYDFNLWLADREVKRIRENVISQEKKVAKYKYDVNNIDDSNWPI